MESSVFPIPPDVMLIPMVLSKPLKAWEYAAITTIASIFGGVLGYSIGFFAFEMIGEPIIQAMGYQAAYLQITQWFKAYGFYAVLLAGFTPIPYKIFTIASGATQMALLPFVMASIVGRGLRFFMVAALVKHFGVKMEPLVVKYIDIMGWLVLGLLILAVIIYKFI